MPRFKFLCASVLVVGFAATAPFALAQSHPDAAKIVKERQEFMGSMWGSYMKSFVPIAKGESTDISQVPAKAAGLAVAAKKIPSYFPAGTGPDAVPGTRARPEIWTDHAAFEKLVDDFAKEAEKLEAVAKTGNVEATKAQVGATFQACLTCHGGPEKSGGKFRTEKS